jgi:IS5 family transposase
MIFMHSFKTYILKQSYKNVSKLGDKLAESDRVDWEAFRPIAQGLYDNDGPSGGRPNLDPVMMVKILVLQAFPESAPDYSTVWRFRERLAVTGRDLLIWAELQRQLDEKGLKIVKGVIQDASFITSDPGHAKADKPRGEEAQTRRSKDGAWAVKGKKSYFGYKLHAKADTNHGLIRDLEVTPANVHDNAIDLSKPGEVVYRDKGFHGVKPRGWDATMRRGARGHPLSIWDRLRNARISRRRAPGERPFAVIKRVFGSGHVLVTTVSRVRVKMVFACLGFDVVQLGRLGV